MSQTPCPGWRRPHTPPLLAVVLLGVLAGPAAAQDPSDGEKLFKSRCTTCHDQAEAVDGVRKRPEAERRAYLDKFLAGHFAPDAAQRQAICDHLLSAAERK